MFQLWISDGYTWICADEQDDVESLEKFGATLPAILPLLENMRVQDREGHILRAWNSGFTNDGTVKFTAIPV